MGQCEFCEIVSGDRDAHILYEDEQTVAWLDSNPATDGHKLVVPKPHHESLFTGEQPVSTPVFHTVETVVQAMNRTLDPDGVSVFYTSGGLVGHITHAHVHLLPRYVDDTVQLALAREPLDDGEAAQHAARIREAL